MRDDQSLAELSAAIFTHLDPVFADFEPDWVLVQGDTTTVAITSLLAYYRRIKVGHVEAGLRTHDKWQPFPEEINRRVAGVIADLHFAPTEQARENLLREGSPMKHCRDRQSGDRRLAPCGGAASAGGSDRLCWANWISGIGI
jgi:UDP-N-acetylglucosamine 2-epimerase (non-hydrolysing)